MEINDDVASRLAEWRQLAAGADPVELPRPRPTATTSTGGDGLLVAEVALDDDAADRVRRTGDALGVEPDVVVIAAVLALLARYGGRRGARTALHTVDGNGSGTVAPIAVTWSPEQTFSGLVDRVAAATQAATHRALPLDARLGEHDAVLTAALGETGIRLGHAGGDGSVTPPHELAVDVAPGPAGPELTVLGAGERFAADDLERVAGHLRTVLDAACADPDQLVDALPILPSAEWDRVVRSWNRTERDRPDTTLHELIGHQIERVPDAVAVDSGAESLTYRQLGTRAESWSSRLRSLGVTRGQVVAVCVPRGVDMVAAVLAVLRSGAAYLPIDPDLPAERVAFMLSDAEVAAIVCTAGTLPLVDGNGVPLHVIGHDADPATTAPPAVTVTGDDPAYVLYTSGSTGTPKGVVLTHRNAVNLVSWIRDTFGVEDRRRIMAATSLSWDLSITELFGALCWGTTAVVVRDVLELAERADELDVTWVNTSPSLIGLLIDRAPLPPSVRVVTLAGEVTSRELAQRIHRRSADLTLWVGYGPTETTTYSTFDVVPPTIAATPTIGRPIDNNQVYLLDDGGAPVPIGCVGEIVIGGTAVAAGYRHRPELTAERFVPDPFSARPGATMYRTGDYARCAPDGAHEFVGRRDAQVKIHGVRIELGEIESRMLELTGVHQAVVTVHRDGDTGNDVRIVAHVVPERDTRLDASDLRTALATRLPRYMIPSAVVTLDALPLNANGKLDRAALPVPPPVAARTLRPERRPMDALGQLVASIMQDATSTDRPLMTDDDFFELGGDSLGALVLLSELESRCGVRLPVATLFDHSTVGDLTTLVGSAPTARPAAFASPVLLRDGTEHPPLFLASTRTGGVLAYRDVVRRLGPDRPIFGLQAPGLDGRVAPARTMRTLAAALADDVQRVQAAGPYLLAGFSFGGMLALEIADVLADRGHRIALVALLDVDPFDQRPVRPDDPRRTSHAGLVGVRRRMALRRDRLRGRWWNATGGRPALNPDPGDGSAAEQVLAINVRIADGWRARPLEHPTALIDGRQPGESSPPPPRRMCRAPVRTASVEYDGAWHNRFMLDPQAADVAAELEASIDWALRR